MFIHIQLDYPILVFVYIGYFIFYYEKKICFFKVHMIHQYMFWNKDYVVLKKINLLKSCK